MEYGLSVITVFSIMVILSMSCYVVILSGEISFGQHAFFGIGAYVAAICTVFLETGLGTGLASGAAAAALVAYVAGLPVLRSRGLQFTIYTMVFAEFVRQVMLKGEWRVVRDDREIGPQGLLGFSGIDYFHSAGMNVVDQAFLCGAIAFVVVILIGWLRQSHFGRMVEAVADDPILAAAVGIDPKSTRLMAFTISGGLAGLGGGLFAHYATYINPENFGLMFGVHAIAYTLLGGVGSVLGPVIGAAFDIVLLEQLRIFGGYRMIVFGSLLVFVLILRPSGLIDRPLSAFFSTFRHAKPVKF